MFQESFRWRNVLRRIYSLPFPFSSSSFSHRSGNCAPPQDVVKSDGSLFPASIILVLDYPDSITRTFASVLRTARLYICIYIYMYLPHTYLVIAIPAAVSAGTAESPGELCPGRSWKIEKSISIFVHELYVNSRASVYEPGEISHYPVRSSPTENRNFRGTWNARNNRSDSTRYKNYWGRYPYE